MTMKSVSGKTSKELLKNLPEWKVRRFTAFWAIGWRSGSKQQAVIRWDRAIPDIDTADLVIERAKDYATNCERRNIPKTMAATWLNQARWEDIPTPKKTTANTKYCPCGSEVAVLEPEPLCCRCWADKYSQQKFNGVYEPYRNVLAYTLTRLEIIPENGETNESYWARCRAFARSALRFDSTRKEGLRRMVATTGVHARGEGGR